MEATMTKRWIQRGVRARHHAAATARAEALRPTSWQRWLSGALSLPYQSCGSTYDGTPRPPRPPMTREERAAMRDTLREIDREEWQHAGQRRGRRR